MVGVQRKGDRAGREGSWEKKGGRTVVKIFELEEGFFSPFPFFFNFAIKKMHFIASLFSSSPVL